MGRVVDLCPHRLTLAFCRDCRLGEEIGALGSRAKREQWARAGDGAGDGMVARYDSTCPRCLGPIMNGSTTIYRDEFYDHWVCEGCRHG